MTAQPTRSQAEILIAGLGLFVLALMTAPDAFAQITITNDSVIYPDGSVQTRADGQPTYKMGETGPAGGFVFYLTADGFHGLEAAPEDQDVTGFGVGWGCAGTDVVGAEGNGIGTGASNTEAIIQGCATQDTAARRAANYVSTSGYFDWFLPSKEALDLMYNNIGPGSINEGGFASGSYWSSSEDSATTASVQDFNGGAQGTAHKSTVYRVRAVRAF